MNCGFDRQLLSMYADGALELERVLNVERHTSDCGECRRILGEMTRIGKALQSVPRENAPGELVERILIRAGAKTRRTTWDATWWTLGAIWTVAMDGFAIGEDLEELLRRESPEWVARWVLFV
jgi:anti-sigma factor RsiW